MGAVASPARQRSGSWRANCGELRRVEGLAADAGGAVRAVGVGVQGDLEALAVVGGGLRVGERRAGIDVGGAAHALPVGDRAARRAVGLVLVEAPAGAAVAVVVAGHHDGRLLAAREVPEPRQRLAVAVHLLDQVGQQPLLLVGLRDRDLVEVDPVGLDVAGLGAEEEVVASGSAPTGRRAPAPAQAGLPWRV